MVIAAHETTLNLITNAVRALCTHPEQPALPRRARVRPLPVRLHL
nr:cytochrome P450 [Streptomyces rectiverticillatus]